MNWDILGVLLAIPALFAVIIYVLGHLLATLLNKPDIKKYVEAELINILFLYVVLMVIPGMDLLSTQYTAYINPEAYNELCKPYPVVVENNRCHVVVAGYHLEMMGRELIDYYGNVFLVQTMIEGINSLGKGEVVEGGKGVDVSLFGMFTAPISYFFRQVEDIMALLTFIEFAQLNLVWIITDLAFFQGLLILGLILRLIPPLKMMGGLLIAIVLGLYYVYPMAVVTVDAHYRYAYDYEPGMGRINRLDFVSRISEIGAGWIAGTDLVRKGSDRVEEELNEFAEKWIEDWSKKRDLTDITNIDYLYTFFKWFSQIVKEIGTLISFLFQVAWLYVTLFYSWVIGLWYKVGSAIGSSITGAYTSDQSDLVPTMFNMISEFMLIIAVLTYLSLISTIAFIKTFSPIIGGDIEIAGITKLI